MNEQAIGFLLQFENKASDALKEAVSDFDAATAALERAVDAAQAAFTFLEEGTGRISRDMTDAVDSAVKKTNELRTSIDGIGDIEVQGPDLDPIMDSLNELGDNISAPDDAGVSEVIDDLNNGIDPDVVDDLSKLAGTLNQPLSEDSWLSALDDAVTDMKSANVVDEWMAALGDAVADAKFADALSAVDELNLRLEQTKGRVLKELKEAFHGAGQAGAEAAESMADDTVEAYNRMTASAAKFIEANAGNFGPNDNVAAMESFFGDNSEDVSKVQDLLRMADKSSLSSLVGGLVTALGDASLSDAFWKPIAANKTVDKEFFQQLRDQFKKEVKTPKAWWERMGTTAQKFFWPHFKKQGEKATEGLTGGLMRGLKSVFSSPIGQLTAALQISRMIEKVFGPFLEELETILGQALMPMMRAMIDIIDELRPTILELSRSLEPLFVAFSEIGREIVKALVPAMKAIGNVLRGVIPVLTTLMKLLSGPIAAALDFVAELIAMVTFVVVETVLAVIKLVAGLKSLLQPAIDAVLWLGRMTGVTKLLAFVIGVVLSPLIVTMAASSLAMLIGSTIKAITATEAFVVAKWKLIAGMYAEGMAVLANITGLEILKKGMWAAVKATYASATAAWAHAVGADAETVSLWGLVTATYSAAVAAWANALGVDANVVGLWGLVTATAAAVAGFVVGLIPAFIAGATAAWAFAAALMANPLTWIVLAVVAAVALLVGIVWALWEPIKTVFNAFVEALQPVWELLGVIWDIIVEIGSFLFDVLLFPLKLVWAIVSGVFEQFSELFSAIGTAFGWIGDLLKWVGGLFVSLGKAVLDWLLTPLKWLASFASMLIQPLKDAFGWIKNLFAGIAEGIASFIDKFKLIGKVAAFLMGGPLGWLIGGLQTIAGWLGFGGDEATAGDAESAVSAGAEGALNPTASMAVDAAEPAVAVQPMGNVAPVTPQVASTMNTGVNYEIDRGEPALDAEQVTKPIMQALGAQTDRLVNALNNSGADDSEDLDLSEMKDLAGF